MAKKTRSKSRGGSGIVRVLGWLLLIAIVVAGVRLAFILRERLKPAVTATKAKPKAPPLHREAYVVPSKLHAYDLASARQICRKPVWVQEGYRYIYYPYDPAHHRVDFFRDVGLLGPIEELHVKDVIAQPTPRQANHHQIVAVFDKNGRTYGVPIGTESGGSFQIYADQMFFYEDPRQLYNFWPAEVWDAIGKHEINPGMNEIQADFAVGMGVPQPQATDPEEKVVQYPNGGHQLTVTYRKGRAVKIAEKD